MCLNKLEVCINAIAVLRFGLEPAELSNEKITNCSKDSLKGQIPLQLAELSGKHAVTISTQEIWDDFPERQRSAV